MIILLSILCIVLLTLLFIVTRKGIESSILNDAWEEFYDSTIQDTSDVITFLENLMKERQIISDDPDVQRVLRSMKIMHDILMSYVNVGSRREEEKKEEG